MTPTERPDEWFSDRALAQQAKAAEREARGEKPSIMDLIGIMEPRRPVTVRCVCCGSDAGTDVGGEPCANGHPFCSLCVDREHNDADCLVCAGSVGVSDKETGSRKRMSRLLRWLRYRLYRVIHGKHFRPTPDSLVIMQITSTGSVGVSDD